MVTLVVRGNGGGLGTVEFPPLRLRDPGPYGTGEPFPCEVCGSERACFYAGDRDEGMQFRCLVCGSIVTLPLLARIP
jgi:hypothetical protein